jgi:hypothetical protein
VAASTNKKVLVTRFERESVAGFLQTPGGLGDQGVELLTPSGSLLLLPYSDVKAVCFVRDFEGGETWREHRAFATRPKTPGLWIKLVFRDHDSTEGLLPNNLMLVEEVGFHIIPPEATSQIQRIFVPRLALREVHVLGVIGSGLRRRKVAKPEMVKGPDQIELF